MIHGKRYFVVRNGAVYDDEGRMGSTATEYHEQDADTWTGLYNEHGDPLHKQREAIGYNPHRWSAAMPDPSQKSKPMKKAKPGKKKGK